jgi:hypothetical protein
MLFLDALGALGALGAGGVTAPRDPALARRWGGFLFIGLSGRDCRAAMVGGLKVEKNRRRSHQTERLTALVFSAQEMMESRTFGGRTREYPSWALGPIT